MYYIFIQFTHEINKSRFHLIPHPIFCILLLLLIFRLQILDIWTFPSTLFIHPLFLQILMDAMTNENCQCCRPYYYEHNHQNKSSIVFIATFTDSATSIILHFQF